MNQVATQSHFFSFWLVIPTFICKPPPVNKRSEGNQISSYIITNGYKNAKEDHEASRAELTERVFWTGIILRCPYSGHRGHAVYSGHRGHER
jgi:hypothetical protein